MRLPPALLYTCFLGSLADSLGRLGSVDVLVRADKAGRALKLDIRILPADARAVRAVGGLGVA